MGEVPACTPNGVLGAVGAGVEKHPDCLGALGCCGLPLWFWLQFLNLSYAPTSRHRKDTGAIIVGIIDAI